MFKNASILTVFLVSLFSLQGCDDISTQDEEDEDSKVVTLAPNSCTAENCNKPPLWIFVMAGQSNMVGYAQNSSLSATQKQPIPNTRIYYNDSFHNNPNAEQWKDLAPGFGSTQYQFGPELSFGREIQAQWPGRNIAIIKVAEGSSGMHNYWHAEDGRLYKLLINEAAAQINILSQDWQPQIAGFVWMQGEEDSVAPTIAQAYEPALLQFLEKLRELSGLPNLPIVAGLISNSPYWVHADTIRGATRQVAKKIRNMELVGTADLPLLPDNAHYNTTSTQTLGKRFATAMLTLIPDTSVPATPAANFHFATDFSDAQGRHSWSYQSSDSTNNVPMNYDSTASRWVGVNGAMIGAGWMHPTNTNTAILRWTAEKSGRVKVNFTIQTPDNRGDGVEVRALLDGIPFWGPTIVTNFAAKTGNSEFYINKGETVEFRTSAGPAQNSNYDTTEWDIKISPLP